jgi:hypothetical protein
MAVVMLDRGVEPVFAVLADRLRRPGVLLCPFEIGDLHDRVVGGPMPHVLRRIDQPFAHVEHLVAPRLIMPDIEIQRVADDERGGIGGELVADDRVRTRRRGIARPAGGRAREHHGKAEEGRQPTSDIEHCTALPAQENTGPLHAGWIASRSIARARPASSFQGNARPLGSPSRPARRHRASFKVQGSSAQWRSQRHTLPREPVRGGKRYASNDGESG